MALEGNLQDMSLPNIMQIICLERRRVGLLLKRGPERGTILFNDGEIAHAAAGALVGDEAVYYLLSWTEGSFSTTNDVRIEQRTIASRWDQLLMEGMKRLDELERDRAANPRAAVRALTAAEIEHDAHLENEMIMLMSRLDTLRARLAERQMQKRPAQALQILTSIANQTLEFSEAIFGRERSAQSLQTIFAQAVAANPAAQGLEPTANRLRPDAVAELYTNASTGSRRQQIYSDVSRSIIGVIDAYFAQLTGCFRSSATISELKEAYEFFLSDLTSVVEQVKA